MRLKQWIEVKQRISSSQGSSYRDVLNLIRSMINDTKLDSSNSTPTADQSEVEQLEANKISNRASEDALSAQQTWNAVTPSSSSVSNSEVAFTAGSLDGWEAQGPPERSSSRGSIPRAECIVINQDIHHLQMHSSSESSFIPSAVNSSFVNLPHWTRHEGYLKQKVGILNTWKERRVVASLGILEIYRSADRTNGKQVNDRQGATPAVDNSITLRAELRDCAVLSKQFGRQHFGIEVKLHNGNKIHFAAQGVMEQSRWIEVIQMQSSNWHTNARHSVR
mmetsp:Transcript_42276/g.133184  ORF Transcript_42276/g.133184 Transcript_42276/m.133184 type:complete len:278 (-) Transcript_42276:948-1781(-)